MSSNGDTVIVTNGSATWAGTLTIPSDKRIYLRGKGIGNTTITGTSGVKLMVVEAGTAYLEISGFSFIEAGTHSGTDGSLDMNGGNWRFCSNSVSCSDGGAFFAIWHTDTKSTLIDRNFVTIQSGSSAAHFALLYGTSGGEDIIYGSNAWNYGTTYGTTNYCTIEHNAITWDDDDERDGIFDAFGGAKFTIRFNIITNAYFGWHGCDSGDKYRSPHSYEIYGNTFYQGACNHYCIFNSRGGTGLVFSNTVVGSFASTGFLMQYYRETTSYGTWGMMTGANHWDGNELGSGYPGIDQQGMTGPSTYYPTYTQQTHSPTYIWANTGDFSIEDDATCIAPGRDWTNIALSGYVPLVDPHPMSGGTNEPIASPRRLRVINARVGTIRAP